LNRSSNALGANDFVTSSVTTRTTENQYVGRLNDNMSAGDTFSARFPLGIARQNRRIPSTVFCR
jgi:hypothetical protein